MHHSFLYFFSLVLYAFQNQFLYTNLSSTCVRCTQKSMASENTNLYHFYSILEVCLLLTLPLSVFVYTAYQTLNWCTHSSLICHFGILSDQLLLSCYVQWPLCCPGMADKETHSNTISREFGDIMKSQHAVLIWTVIRAWHYDQLIRLQMQQPTLATKTPLAVAKLWQTLLKHHLQRGNATNVLLEICRYKFWNLK